MTFREETRGATALSPVAETPCPEAFSPPGSREANGASARERAGAAGIFALLGIGLPAACVAWARATADVVRIPAVFLPSPGIAVASFGALLLLAEAARILFRPKAVPPPLAGRLIPHPLSMGICAVSAGMSIATGSGSGLWLVSPVLMLACAALVYGYERPESRARAAGAPLKILPAADDSSPALSDFVACYVFVLIPWLVLYEAILAIGMPPDAISGVSRFERGMPVIEWTQVFYGSTYLFVTLAPFIAKTRRDLRSFCTNGLGTMLVVYPAFLLIPLIAPKRPFVAHGLPGRLLLWERTLDSPVAAFPSFHVTWAILAAEVFSRRWPRLKGLFYGWAGLIAVSCVTTSQHSILDVAGGIATVALVWRAPRFWEALRGKVERMARSRRERRIGPVLAADYGFYAGAGAFAGLWLAATAAGQAVHGDVALSGTGVWLIPAALALGAPWAEALWNLRCLARGCSYGSPAAGESGMRYLHSRPFASRPGGWSDVPLHAAPLYAMAFQFATALVVIRLWTLAAPLHLIAGLYLILSGLGRFAAEGWRGEREFVFARLRRGHCAAVLSVLAGALVTALGHSGPAPAPRLSLWSFLPAAVGGLAVAIAAGVERPARRSGLSRVA